MVEYKWALLVENPGLAANRAEGGTRGPTGSDQIRGGDGAERAPIY